MQHRCADWRSVLEGSSECILNQAKNLAMRVYREVVRRRTTVRTHQAVWPPRTIDLHFLLGLYRSGTTPLRYSVGMHPNVAAPPESDFLVPFLQSGTDSRSIRGLDFMGFDQEHVQAAYRQTAHYFFSTYAQSLGPENTVVIDKSPRYVEHADSLRKLFPESRFLVLVRHPFGQIGSATKYLKIVPKVPDFPSAVDDLAMSASQYWRDRTQSLVDFLEVEPERALLVRYEDLCTDPAPQLDRIVDHLGLTQSDELLQYDGGQFDRGLEGAKALSHSQFEASMADPMRGWSENETAQLERMWQIAGDLAQSLEYERGDLQTRVPDSDQQA